MNLCYNLEKMKGQFSENSEIIFHKKSTSYDWVNYDICTLLGEKDSGVPRQLIPFVASMIFLVLQWKGIYFMANYSQF